MTTEKFGAGVAANWSDEAYADARAYLSRRAELVRTLGPPLVSGDRVLDLACGDGGLGAFLMAAGMAYLGVDRSEAMVLAASARLGTKAEVVLADLNQYRPPTRVAATTIFRALYYVTDRPAFFSRVGEFTDKKLVFDLNPRRFDLDAIRAELGAAGFSRLELHPFFVPQTVALPAPLLRALTAAERLRPVAAALLRFRFSYVCAASRNER